MRIGVTGGETGRERAQRVAAVIAADTARWAKVIKDAKIELRP